MATRVYQKQYNSRWKLRVSQMRHSMQPIFLIKIDTTGLDPMVDRVINVVISKNHFVDNQIVCDDIYQSLCNPGIHIPEEITKFNGITDELVSNAKPTEIVMQEVCQFLGESANICGFNTREFLGPFLDNECNRAGIKFPLQHSFDMIDMAKAVLAPAKARDSYGYVRLAQRLGVDINHGMQGYIDVFNKLFVNIPNGQSNIPSDVQFVQSINYWGKAYNRRYLFLQTMYGQVAINCLTGYFEEKTPGYFDVVNMDEFADYLLQISGCRSIREFINRYTPAA